MVFPFASQGDLPPYLEVQEIELLINGVQEPWSTFFDLLWQTGLRVSEALAVKRDDVGEDELHVKRLKRKKEFRDTVTILPPLRARLLRLRSSHGLLFPYSRQAAWYVLKATARRVGMDPKKVHPHIFRHSFAVHLGERLENDGMPFTQALPTLQSLLGHANAGTTAVYLRRSKEQVKAAYKRVMSKKETR